MARKSVGPHGLALGICSESLGEDMNRCENLVTIGFANIAVLHKEILGILRKVRGCEDAESRSAIVLERSRLELWVSEPGQIAAVELDVFGRDGERIVLRVSRVKGDLGRLDLGDDMEGSVVRSNAKGDEKLATSSGRMHGESRQLGHPLK